VPDKAKRVDSLSLLFLGLLFCIGIAARRPLQVLAPDVWNESGTYLLPSIIEKGLASWIEPVAGYSVLSARIIDTLALMFSFAYFPEISTYFSLLLATFVCLTVALSPTILRYPLACALALVFLPVEPEVYVIPLYSIWWMNILLLVSLLWRPEASSKKNLLLRSAFITIGSLSTPLAPLFAFFQCIKALILRGKSEIILGILSVMTGLVQLSYLRSSGSASGSNILGNLAALDLKLVLTRFVAEFYYSPLWEVDWQWMVALIGLLVLVGLALKQSLRKKHGLMILTLLFFIVVALTLVRTSIEGIHHLYGAPRYFFFPFLLLSWIMIQLFDWKESKIISSFVILGFLSSAIKIFPHYSRLQDPLDWRQDISNCLSWDQFVVSIQYTGSNRSVWPLPIDKKLCQQAVSNSLLDDRLKHLWFKAPTRINTFVSVEMPFYGGSFCPECTYDLEVPPHVQSLGFAQGAVHPDYSNPKFQVYGTYGLDGLEARQLILTYLFPKQHIDFFFLASGKTANLKVSFARAQDKTELNTYELPFISGWNVFRYQVPHDQQGQAIEVTLSDTGPEWIGVALPNPKKEVSRIEK
jgi:hypothetical protein